MKLTKKVFKEIVKEEFLTENQIKSQLKLLAKLLKRTGATLKIKGSTITIDLRTGGMEGAMEFQWPKIVKEKW